MGIILGGEQCFFSEEYLINWFLAKKFCSYGKNSTKNENVNVRL